MGRHAGPWKLEWRGAGAVKYGYVRFSHNGTRYLVSTGKTDKAGASSEAARIYARVQSGLAPVRPSHGAVIAASLTDLFAEWLASLEGVLDAETARTYRVTYAGKHWPAHYETIEDMCKKESREAYRNARLRLASASTVKKETWAQDKFLRWCRDSKILAPERIPPALEWDTKTLGTRTGTQRQFARELRPEQVRDVVAALPEWFETGKRALERDPYPIRDRFVFGYETGLRPGTLSELVWSDWTGDELRIRAEADKIRYGRVVPLTDEAKHALARVFDGSKARGRSTEPKAPIFGHHAMARALNEAGKAAGLDGCAPYDLRHARATHMADSRAGLPAIGYVLGHKQATTTNRYLHSGKEMAKSAISGSILGISGSGVEKLGWPTGLEPAPPGATIQIVPNNIKQLAQIGANVDTGKSRRKPAGAEQYRFTDPQFPRPKAWVLEAAGNLLAKLAGVAE